MTKGSRWGIDCGMKAHSVLERKYDMAAKFLREDGPFGVFDALAIFFGELKAKDICDRNNVPSRSTQAPATKRKRSDAASSGGDPILLSPNQRRQKRQNV